jgi:hypothetical protein
MSLLNDALKQASAKTQTNTATPANGPALRPTPPIASRRTAGNDFLLPALVVVILLLAAVLLWQWFRGGKNELQVRARTIPAVETARPSTPGPQPTVSTPAPTAVAQPSIAGPEKTVATNPLASVAAPISATNIALPATNTPPPPPAYKLQSIFYSAKSPSAFINGKMLFIGDRIGHTTAHVVAITQDSATIITTNGETKILELP